MTRLSPRVAALVLVLAATSSCDGPGVVSPDRQLLPIGGGAPTLSDAIVGAWTRNIVFVDDFDVVRSSETVWQFSDAGEATRTVTTENLTTGAVDVVVTTAQWRVEDTTLVIDFVTPTPGTIRLDARVEGDQLILAGEPYLRSSV